MFTGCVIITTRVILLTFRDVLTRGKKSLKKIKVITLSTGFCTLVTSVIVKVLLKLMQQVTLN